MPQTTKAIGTATTPASEVLSAPPAGIAGNEKVAPTTAPVSTLTEYGSSFSGSAAGQLPRTLFKRHFAKSLTEITPTASETSGTLAELRRWNEEYGENGKAGKKRRMWNGRFGFSLADSPSSAHDPSLPASPGKDPNF